MQKAIFFDLDGTLLDSIEDLADAGNAVLAKAGFPTHPVSAYCYFIGDGMENMVQRAVPEGTPDTMLHELLLQAKKLYAEQWSQKTRPYAGIVDMLQQLQDKNVVMTVLSNKPHDFTLAMVQHFFPKGLFAAIQGSPPGSKAKPDPTLALQMAQDLDLTPDQILFVGDTRTDMDTATAAKMFPVGVLWGFRPKSELVAHGAKVVLAKPSDIFQYV